MRLTLQKGSHQEQPVVQPAAADDKALRRHLEDRERLLYTSRALSVSEMASTLAHELNQPIGTVANVLRGLKSRLEAVTPEATAAREKNATQKTGDGLASPRALLAGVQLALDQALFAARVIARIRDYAHTRQPQKETLDLCHLVRDSLALMDWEIQRDAVALQLEMPDRPCYVLGDAVMLQQLIVNLLRNALEAMREDDPTQRQLHLGLAVRHDDLEAELSICDSGCGMPLDAEHRLFVPFQSSKPNGMGIGLNICRSFAELHQGRLWFTRNAAPSGKTARKTAGKTADSSLKGSTFHVALPTTLLPLPEMSLRTR